MSAPRKLTLSGPPWMRELKQAINDLIDETRSLTIIKGTTVWPKAKTSGGTELEANAGGTSDNDPRWS